MRGITGRFILLLLVLTSEEAMCQRGQDTLQLVTDSVTGTYAYVNAKADTVIPAGKYIACFTERFSDFAIVCAAGKGFIGIDRLENILFNVHAFDNGPDEPSGGLFRIIKNGKIGYANLHGKIVIPATFDGAYPFKHGRAEVGHGCILKTDGEHSWWVGGDWLLINKKGEIIKKISRK